MLRPAIVIRCAQAVGGSWDSALPGAVAVELAHNSSLLQDDVMDHDRLRRHRPTAWTVFGESAALLAGDALIVLALSVLLRHGSASRVTAANALAETYQRLVVGQVLDLDFEARSSVTTEDCYRMADGKTASLLACAARLGAVLGGADTATTTALEAFGRHLGLAFQLVDDVLGIWGNPARTGKPVGADIRTRKKSLPVAFALSIAEPSDDLTEFYTQSHVPDDEQIRSVTARLGALGALAWTRAETDQHLQAATRSLDEAHLSATGREELLALIDFAGTRTW
nr:polyprenyl synthetase family protein [Streptomyces sp. SID13031]